jgi:hypothetical protein
VVFVAFALRDGLTPPRVGGGPPAATAARAFGAGRPAFAVRISEFPGGVAAFVAALREYAPAELSIE